MLQTHDLLYACMKKKWQLNNNNKPLTHSVEVGDVEKELRVRVGYSNIVHCQQEKNNSTVTFKMLQNVDKLMDEKNILLICTSECYSSFQS